MFSCILRTIIDLIIFHRCKMETVDLLYCINNNPQTYCKCFKGIVIHSFLFH